MNPTRILRSLLAERLGQTAGRWPRELFGEMEAPTLRQAIAERMTSPAPRAASPIETLEPRLADGPDAGAPVTSNASTAPDGGASGAGNAYREQLRAEGFNVDEPVYHGTNADFEHFDPARASGQGMYGDGAGYFATAPQWANEFARGEGANVRQVYVRGNIFDTGRHTASHRGSPALIADYARLYQQKGMDFAASGIERHLQNGNFLAAYQQAVRDLGTFAELGYDGVRGASSLAGDEIVVFSPDNIAPRWRAPDAPNASPPSTGNGGRNGAALAALASLPPGALTLRELLRDHYRAA